MIEFREAELADMVDLAPRLRPEDRAECLAALGVEPEVALKGGLSWGKVWVWTVNGRPEAALGLTEVSPEAGAVWMMASQVLLKHTRYMVRHLSGVMDMLHDHYPLLGNCVDKRNAVHINFIKHCGFSFLRVIPDYGIEKRPFIEFAKLRARHV